VHCILTEDNAEYRKDLGREKERNNRGYGWEDMGRTG